MANFWKGEEGDASHSYPVLSISNSSFSPHHHLSPGLLLPLPNTLPWLYSVYGSKSSPSVRHEGSTMSGEGRGRIQPSWALTISSPATLDLMLIDPVRGQAGSHGMGFARAGSFCRECLFLPSPAPPPAPADLWQAWAGLASSVKPSSTQGWSVFRAGRGSALVSL